MMRTETEIQQARDLIQQAGKVRPPTRSMKLAEALLAWVEGEENDFNRLLHHLQVGMDAFATGDPKQILAARHELLEEIAKEMMAKLNGENDTLDDAD